MQRKVTIKDVAEHAGVAVSTVSRVINNKDRVDPDTRGKVRGAIEELGYIRNNLAASIKTGSTGFIVTVVPDIINEFYTSVIRGVEAAASAKGYHTLVFATSESRSKELEVFGGEFGRMVDGVVLVPSTANCSIYKSIDKPTVIIDRDMPGSDMYSVTIDNYKGAHMLVQELIDHCHSKIAIITGPSVFNVGIDRMNGYLDALIENHIALKDEYICAGTWYEEDGYRFAESLLKLNDPPTAIFAGNNLLCMGCAEYLQDCGIAIGRDISLVGFDDSPVARYIGPGITGIRRATDEMGRLGSEMLIKLMENRASEIKEKKVVLDVELIRRNSIATIG
jgi:DNA-binding LacI/PurR family transcriptional regulator